MSRQVFATFDYQPASMMDNIELAFKRGDAITVKQENSSNWWTGSLQNGAKGLFPATFTSGVTENAGSVPARGTFYQTMKFGGLPPSPASKRIVVAKQSGFSRLPSAPAPSAPLEAPPQPASVAKANGVIGAPLKADEPSAKPAAPVKVEPAKVEREKVEVPKEQLTLEQARALLAKKEPAVAAAAVESEKTTATARGPLLRKGTFGRTKDKVKRASVGSSSFTADPSMPKRRLSIGTSNVEIVARTKSEPTVAGSPTIEKKQSVGASMQRTLRGILKGGTVFSKEAPALLQSSPRELREEARRKERASYQEMATTKSQSMAAEKFKNQMSRIYEHDNLANVRQVFDGLAGSEAADEADQKAFATKQTEDEEEIVDEFATEMATSRAALDLCSASPKMYLVAPDSPAERLRVVREMETADRQAMGRRLWFDEERSDSTSNSNNKSNTNNSNNNTGSNNNSNSINTANRTVAVPSALRTSQQAAPKMTRVRSDSLSSPTLAHRSRSEIATAKVLEETSIEDAKEVGFWEALKEETSKKKPIESEEVRRVMYFGQCIGSEWAESHGLKQRCWAEGSMAIPVLKAASWNLVELSKEGEFHVEVGQKPPCDVVDFPLGTYKLEDVDCYRFWMKDFFLNARHQYFLCQPEEGGAGGGEKKRGFKQKEKSESGVAKDTVLIVVRLGDEDRGDPSHIITYHKHGTARVQCLYSSTKQLEWFLRKSPYIKNLTLQGVRPYLNGPLDRHMLQWERGSVQKAFKFGVVYVANGQKTEDAFYSNERGSEEFRLFLARLGNVIALKGHPGYRAGLNVTHNLTGFLSVYNTVTFNEDGEFLYDLTSNPSLEDKDHATLKFQLEIMFHVSTFLPFSPENPQQLHRKRHIGNDVCVVVFKERSNTGLDASGKPLEQNFAVPVGQFTSQFNHVFIVVTPWKFDTGGRTTHYKVTVCSKDGVRPCRPFLPKNGIISLKKFTPWILAKLVNCERSSMYAKSFSQKEARTNLAMMAEAIAVTSTRGKRN